MSHQVFAARKDRPNALQEADLDSGAGYLVIRHLRLEGSLLDRGLLVAALVGAVVLAGLALHHRLTDPPEVFRLGVLGRPYVPPPLPKVLLEPPPLPQQSCAQPSAPDHKIPDWHCV